MIVIHASFICPFSPSLSKTWFIWPFRLPVEWATYRAARSSTRIWLPGIVCKWPRLYYRQLSTASFGSFRANHHLISPFDSIDDNMQVKITDNALARDLFPMDYHCLGDNENRPVRWMALESLLNNDFSSLSDVVTSSVPRAVWNTQWILAVFSIEKVAFDTFADLWLRCRREGSSASLFPVRRSRHVWDGKLNRSGEAHRHSIRTLSSCTWQWFRHASVT